MTFLNGFVLFGLVAAVVPILIHLLQLKKLRRVDFSSIRFLKEIQHASAKRVKLRDYLLLLLRTLAIASLVVAFARPALKGAASGDSKSSSVVIIDNSPSTSARNEYGEIFSQIKSVASQLINSFRAGDDVSLVFTSRAADPSRILSTIDPRSLSTKVTRAERSDVSGSYLSAIDAAVDKLGSSNYLNKEIYVLGDLQKDEFTLPSGNSGRGAAGPRNIPPGTMIFFLGTPASPNDNLSVSNVKLMNPVVETNTPSDVQATLTNNGGAGKSGVVVSLYLDDRKVAQSVADLPPGSSRTVDLAFSVLSSGYHTGVIQIDDNSIQSDNRDYFSFYAIQELKVVLVTSDSASDFVLSAAHATMDTSTVIDTKVVTPGQFVYTNLSGADVVIVESYLDGQNFRQKLVKFVRDGGGAVLFAPAAGQSAAFGEITSAMNLGRVSKYFTSVGGSFLSIDRIDAGDNFFHGIFSTKQSADQIKNQLVTKVFECAQIEPSPFAHVLMSTSSGPFLMGGEVGSGFTLVVASPADTGSSNFSESPFFPVVIQRAMFYSAAVRHKPIQVYAGEPVDYRYSLGGIKSAILISPDRTKTEIVPQYVGAGAEFVITGLDRLGTYTLANGDTLCEISVNVDPRESDLAQATKSEITAYSKKLGFRAKDVFVLNADKNAVARLDKLRRGEDLSSFFAGAALFFLVLEIFVSRMKTFDRTT